MVNRIRQAVGWAGAATWLLLPVVCIVAISQEGADHTDKIAVEWSPVGRDSAERSQPVSLQLTVGSVASIFAPPGLSGLVDSVAVHAGEQLSNGAPVASIGGIQRVSVISDAPFSRSLQYGSQGADVAALNEFLRSESLPADADDWFGGATVRGIMALSKQIGAPKSAVFDPSWFIFIPRGATAVAKVAIQPGMSAPAPGSPILDLTPTLASARWADPADSSGSTGNAAPDLVPGARLLVNGKRVTTLTPKNANETGLVGPRVLARLASVLPPDAVTADGVVVSAAPADSVTVSVAAIYTDEAARSCVRWRSRGSNKVRVSEVSLIDSVAGDAIVTDLPREATQVQVNPPTTLRQPCS